VNNSLFVTTSPYSLGGGGGFDQFHNGENVKIHSKSMKPKVN